MIVYSGEGVVNKLINKLPFELHLPRYQFCGPGTKLEKRLLRGDKGYNRLDQFCKNHDIAYAQHNDLSSRHKADKILEEAAWSRVKAKDASFSEKAASWLVTNIMKAKRRLGMGMRKSLKGKRKKKTQKVTFKGGILKKLISVVKDVGSNIGSGKELIKYTLQAARRIIKSVGGKKNVKVPRVIPVPKEGGVLPLIPIFAGLSALGAIAGGTAQIAKAVNQAKDAKKQLDEGTRHNKFMETIAMSGRKSGTALYLKPYKKHGGSANIGYLPNRALTDVDLRKYAKNVPYFRGVFMRDSLPVQPFRIERGIVNHDDLKGPGSHWTAYRKDNNVVFYYDPFGDLRPPREIVKYFHNCDIYYNSEQEQDYDTYVCGHLCLKFLYKKSVYM
ncbi:hypothetical protein ILUMI_20419 [Ignelater luminosus]|uniref:Phospholipase A2-like domain-containing protein n=1 Tax=Ignelater luminosus TaxID=2038154 RepID=A0A8K0CE72_IGNLU|nr:hypothetical protein ILUMI_20419 [Ignelater luminosus]